MLYGVFLVGTLSVGALIVLRQRPLDLFSIAFLGAVFYFLPLIVGVVPQIAGAGVLTRDRFLPVELDAYLIAFLVIAAILLGSLLYGAVRPARSAAPLDQDFAAGFVGLALFGLGLHLATDPGPLFTPDKPELLTRLGYAWVLFEAAAALACVEAFRARRWAWLAVSVVLLLVDVLAGFRYLAILVVLAGAVLSRSPIRLVTRLPAVGLALLLIVTLAILVGPVRNYGAQHAFSTIFTTDGLWDQFFRLEPFVTQSILNEVLRSNLVCRDYDWRLLAASVLPLGRVLDVPFVSFEQEFMQLFPTVTFGMAGNPWAEAACRGGWRAIAVLIAVFVAIIAALQYGLDRSNSALTSFFALSGVIMAFYAHRNDMFYTFLMIRRVAIVFIVIWAAHWVLHCLTRRERAAS